jgi:hypothetical protein
MHTSSQIPSNPQRGKSSGWVSLLYQEMALTTSIFSPETEAVRQVTFNKKNKDMLPLTYCSTVAGFLRVNNKNDHSFIFMQVAFCGHHPVRTTFSVRNIEHCKMLANVSLDINSFPVYGSKSGLTMNIKGIVQRDGSGRNKAHSIGRH